jgi:N-acetylglucosamine kinase-like BadF-type ATPase
MSAGFEGVIGLDGGGSKTLAVLADRDGHELGRGTADASNYQVVGVEAASTAIVKAIRTAFESAGIAFQPTAGLCLGLAGVGRPEDRAWVEALVRRENLARNWTIANDGQLLLWAGTPDGWGVGIISGTGSIVYGRAADGREARAGGWGYILGDEGSGYAIGKAALQAVAQAADGRGPQTELTTRLLDYWNLERPWDLVGQVYRSGVGRVEIATLAGVVSAAAQAGDSVAQTIEAQAGRELALQAAAVARQLEFGGDVPTGLGGGVLAHNPRLAQYVIAEASALGVTLAPVERVSEPVVGAVRLARRL